MGLCCQYSSVGSAASIIPTISTVTRVGSLRDGVNVTVSPTRRSNVRLAA